MLKVLLVGLLQDDFTGCPRGLPYQDPTGNYVGCVLHGHCPLNYDCYEPFCCPSKAHICSQPLDVGVECSKGESTKFRYDAKIDSCRSFKYKGCSGNDNIFHFRQECETFCSKRYLLKCPYSNQFPFVPVGNGNIYPKTCAPGLNDCPAGFACYETTSSDNYVCCTSHYSRTVGECPDNSMVYLNPDSKFPQKCTNNHNSCPTGFLCWYSSALGENYCCFNTASTPTSSPTDMTLTPQESSNVCVSGKPYLYPQTKTPLVCPLNHTCPEGFHCERVRNRHFGVCCPKASKEMLTEHVDRYFINSHLTLANCEQEIWKNLGKICCTSELCHYNCRSFGGKTLCSNPKFVILHPELKPHQCCNEKAEEEIRKIV